MINPRDDQGRFYEWEPPPHWKPTVLSNEPSKRPGVYRIELVCVYSWTEYTWTWTVYDWDGDEPLWHGTATTKFGARYAANRAVRKLRRGKRPKEVSDRDTYYSYP